MANWGRTGWSWLACLVAAAGCAGLPRGDAARQADTASAVDASPVVRAADPDPPKPPAGRAELGVPQFHGSGSGEHARLGTPLACDADIAGAGHTEPLFADLANLSAAEFTFHDDREAFLCDLWQDTHALVTWPNGLVLGAGAAASLAFHETLDDDVADRTRGHSHRWGAADNMLQVVGNPITHASVSAGLYAYSLFEQDPCLHDLSKSLIDAIAIDAVATELLKLMANTNRPNGDRWGWPSGHVSSSMAVAGVLDEYYGHRVGVPAMVLAGLIGWERIDDRQHDLSDVVFGGVLGFVIGKTVGGEHHMRFCGMELVPDIDPVAGMSGVGLEKVF